MTNTKSWPSASKKSGFQLLTGLKLLSYESTLFKYIIVGLFLGLVLWAK